MTNLGLNLEIELLTGIKTLFIFPDFGLQCLLMSLPSSRNDLRRRNDAGRGLVWGGKQTCPLLYWGMFEWAYGIRKTNGKPAFCHILLCGEIE